MADRPPDGYLRTINEEFKLLDERSKNARKHAEDLRERSRQLHLRCEAINLEVDRMLRWKYHYLERMAG